jgi:hypothetical protein
MNLYQLTTEYESLMSEAQEYAAEHEGEIYPDLAAKIDALELTREQKIENSIRWYKSQKALTEMIGHEIDVLKKRAKVHESNCDFIKTYLAGNIPEGKKYEFPAGQIGWRRSTSTEITDATAIQDGYCHNERKIHVKEIGDALKNGEEVPGAKLVEKNNIQVR